MADWLDYEEAYEGGGARIAGTVKVLRGVRSEVLGNTRDILVYLPPSYPTANRTYPLWMLSLALMAFSMVSRTRWGNARFTVLSVIIKCRAMRLVFMITTSRTNRRHRSRRHRR